MDVTRAKLASWFDGFYEDGFSWHSEQGERCFASMLGKTIVVARHCESTYQVPVKSNAHRPLFCVWIFSAKPSRDPNILFDRCCARGAAGLVARCHGRNCGASKRSATRRSPKPASACQREKDWTPLPPLHKMCAIQVQWSFD